MIIDFHTHIFPDKIADSTIEILKQKAKIKAYTKATLQDLKQSMNEAGVDLSVVLPVVTKPSQFGSILKFALKISREEGIQSFGGIHPQTENYKKELDEIAASGLPGIKLHPDYQKTFIDDEKMMVLVQYAINKGLHVVFHAGIDVGYPEPVHCPPDRAAKLLSKLDYGKEEQGKLIFAHTGGHEQWDDVETYLVGKEVYFDLAYNLGKIPDQQLKRMIKNHGAERFLFATDSPWDGQKQDVEYLEKLDLPEEVKKAIFSENAKRLLKIEQ